MKKRIANIVVLALLVAGTCGWAVAQAKEETPDRAVVPLSNPAKPAKIEVTVMRGSITVKGYQGKEIIVEARVREKALPGRTRRLLFHGPPTPSRLLTPPPGHRPPPRPRPAAKPGKINERAQREVEAQARGHAGRPGSAGQEDRARSYDRSAGLYGQFFGDARKPARRKRRRSPA